MVHHPLAPERYTRIAVYGALVFLAATILNEFLLTRERPGLRRMLVVIGSSPLLSFGIGMLSGGLQHFDGFPARGAVLVPGGLAVAAVAYFGLRDVAASIKTAPDGQGHSHGTAEQSTTRGPAADDHASTTGPSAPAAGSTAPTAGLGPKAPGHDDGHSH
ncbi:hypothetical protein [Streptomyces sp. NPDC057686]|uniref:hypothetical protein n=1 Tax=Streptomyces sp. NPDC057686 TaxID=3346212 RepID=UPI0036B58614